jgi:ketosteroid isomerase-like protein
VNNIYQLNATLKTHDTISAINMCSHVMNKTVIVFLMAIVVLASCSSTTKKVSDSVDIDQINQEIISLENAFAKTMADRDFDAFAAFIADDAVFFSGSEPMRGKAAVLDDWRKYYEGEQAPFGWQAEVVEVNHQAGIALSNGPVFTASGELFARFNSVWQRQADGRWLVIFDKGTSLEDFKQQ